MGFRGKDETEFDIARRGRYNVDELIFSKELILPKEQLDGLSKIYHENVQSRKFKSNIDKEEYEGKIQDILKEIVKKLHNERLDNPGRITLVHSKGGSNSTSEHLFGESKTPFVMIDVNGVIILEAIGEANNASFIAKKTDDFLDNIKTMGRTEIQKKGIAEKITHDQSVKGYDFESGHVLDLIDLAMEHKNQMFNAMKRIHDIGKQFCTLKTLKGYIAADLSNDIIKQAGITEREALNAADEVVISNEHIKPDEKGDIDY